MSLPVPQIPPGIRKSASLKKVLWGLGEEGMKRLSPERLADITSKVTRSGWMHPQGQRNMLLSLAIGPKGALNAMKARYAQGGVLGKGGLVRGDLAFNPEMFERIKRIRSGTASWKDYPGVAGHVAGAGLNTAGVLAAPALLTADAAMSPLAPGENRVTKTLGSLGSGLGWALGGPLGLGGDLVAGTIGGAVGGTLGTGLEALVPPTPRRAAQIATSRLPTQLNEAMIPAVRAADPLRGF
jgi:hypothetical protein